MTAESKTCDLLRALWRRSCLAAVMAAIFWGIWYIIAGHLPATDNPVWPALTASHWLDIPAAAFWITWATLAARLTRAAGKEKAEIIIISMLIGMVAGLVIYSTAGTLRMVLLFSVTGGVIAMAVALMNMAPLSYYFNCLASCLMFALSFSIGCGARTGLLSALVVSLFVAAISTATCTILFLAISLIVGHCATGRFGKISAWLDGKK